MTRMRLGFAARLLAGLAGVAVVTGGLLVAGISNPTTTALAYLLVTLFVASLGDLLAAVVTSVVATLSFNYFFLPPVGTFTIADPHNWVALVSFLIVSIVASRLSASAQARAREALDRRNELTRLFDLTRDILLTTEREGTSRAGSNSTLSRSACPTGEAGRCIRGARRPRLSRQRISIARLRQVRA